MTLVYPRHKLLTAQWQKPGPLARAQLLKQGPDPHARVRTLLETSSALLGLCQLRTRGLPCFLKWCIWARLSLRENKCKPVSSSHTSPLAARPLSKRRPTASQFPFRAHLLTWAESTCVLSFLWAWSQPSPFALHPSSWAQSVASISPRLRARLL